MIVKRPKIYGLIGYPVKHSLSPAMHNAAFQALKINAEYRLFELKEQELASFLESLSEKNIFGLNVTIPYKEKVITFLDKVSSEAKLIGAVNTIKVDDNKLLGFNTDGEGFLRHLTEDLKFNPKDKVMAIIGAGGASRAVSVYLSKCKPYSITIYDIDKTKSLRLVNHLKENFKKTQFNCVDTIEELNIASTHLLINATPMGMKETDPSLVDEGFFHKGLLVYDLIYNPRETRLLKLAKKNGARVSSGLGMLLYQGMLSFEIWTKRKAPKRIMQKALLEELCLQK
jgi:shikimate dehydrogenase